jgi:hypothetical protein
MIKIGEIKNNETKRELSEEIISILSDYGIKGIAVIQAFFDESGTHGGSDLLVVAGWFGNRKAWKSFIKEWRVCLARAGVPHFHAKDSRCESLKALLVQAILKRDLYGVVRSVNPLDFKKYASDSFKNQFGNAYSMCAFECAQEMHEIAVKNKLDSIAVYYEAGQPNTDFIVKSFNRIMTYIPDFGLSEVSIVSKKDFIPLQAADFLAHTISTNNTKWVDMFYKSKKVEWVQIDSEAIKLVSEFTKKASRILKTHITKTKRKEKS